MKNIIKIILLILTSNLIAQKSPAPDQNESFLITGATIHTGNSKVIENGCIGVDSGKIIYVGEYFSSNTELRKLKKQINAKGKQIYPGFIALGTSIGLQEIESVRATIDYNETGIINASVDALTAYNTDSKVIPTIRNNGVLLAQIKPEGGTISGQSATVQLDAWNWEDAVIKDKDGVWINWPNIYKWQWGEGMKKNVDYDKSVVELENIFLNSTSYMNTTQKESINLNFEALIKALKKENNVYVRASEAQEIIDAIRFIKKYDLKGVLFNPIKIKTVLEIIAKSKIPVILDQTHRLPNDNGNTDEFYEIPKILADNRIVFAIAIDGYYQVRNLNYQAGQAVAYGLKYEDAVSAITLIPAQILGIDKKYGSIEVGKSATFFISNGDALDMRSSTVEKAFIDGRDIDLDDKQKDLYHKYKNKYEKQ
jgi:imidazolonepropionase-like amidohydrolase